MKVQFTGEDQTTGFRVVVCGLWFPAQIFSTDLSIFQLLPMALFKIWIFYQDNKTHLFFKFKMMLLLL